jgi:hypothetical protein
MGGFYCCWGYNIKNNGLHEDGVVRATVAIAAAPE